MKSLRYLLPALALLLVLSSVITPPLSAAQATSTVAAPPATAGIAVVANPNVIITSPLLVSELHGTVNVTGTADLPNMRSYFLETRPLNADASLPNDDVAWVPATLPATTAVQNGALATWDTTLVPDGLYELRLTVTTDNVPSVYFVVAPLRINNEAFLAANPTPVAGGSTGTGATPDLTPRLTARLTSNVRTGDSTLYPVVGILLRNTTVPVLGVSTTGSGWFYIQIPNGPKGWISPFVVITVGDFSGLPAITPPPLPPPPPTSAVTRTPTGLPATFQLNGIALSPGTPTCGQTFNVQANVLNSGSVFSPAGTVFAQDVHIGTGTVTATGTAGVPALSPGANFVVTIPLTTTMYYNETHQVQVNLNGVQVTTIYTLTQGTCNVAPTTTAPTLAPAPSATSVPPSPVPPSPQPSATGTAISTP